MKSMNEYIFEKTGMSLEAQDFAHKVKDYFSYEGVSVCEDCMKFSSVEMKRPVTSGGVSVLEEGKKFESLEIKKNGWMRVCEGDGSSFTVMNHDLKESFVLPSMIPVLPHEGGYDKFPSVNAIQMGAMADLQRVIATVKKLSLEDANYLKSIMGPSLEEKILRSIVDAVLYDTPPANGQSNGV